MDELSWQGRKRYTYTFQYSRTGCEIIVSAYEDEAARNYAVAVGQSSYFEMHKALTFAQQTARLGQK